MCRVGRAERFISWIACFAILMSALAPAISQALRGGSPDTWAEVCTTLGAKLVLVDGGAADKSSPGAPSDHLSQHCPYCSLHSTVGLPPTAATSIALQPLAYAVPRLFLAAPRTLHAWVSAQPRAPPQLS